MLNTFAFEGHNEWNSWYDDGDNDYSDGNSKNEIDGDEVSTDDNVTLWYGNYARSITAITLQHHMFPNR